MPTHQAIMEALQASEASFMGKYDVILCKSG